MLFKTIVLFVLVSLNLSAHLHVRTTGVKFEQITSMMPTLIHYMEGKTNIYERKQEVKEKTDG